MSATTRRFAQAIPLALLLLASLASIPPAQAQSGGTPALAIVYRDDFRDDNESPDERARTAWSPSLGAGNAAEGAGWFQVIDEIDHDANASTAREPHNAWYAARATSTANADDSDPAGYDNDVDVRLTSPSITLPTAYAPRAIALTVRGSSEADFDVLYLEWAPSPSSPDSEWETIGRWSGDARAASYALVVGDSARLARHDGPLAIRLRFDSNDSCPSNDVTTSGLPPHPGSVTSPIPPGTVPGSVDVPEEEVPDDVPDDVPVPGEVPVPVQPPGEVPVPGYPVDPTEETAPGCGIGWFVDQVDLVGRLDFTLAADPAAERVPVEAGKPGVTVDLFGNAGDVLEFRLDPATTTVPSGVDSVLVRVDRRDSADVFDFAALKGSDGVWTALFAVDEPDLVSGIWDVSFFGTAGGSGSLLGSTALTVRAQDQTVPRLTTSPGGNPVKLGPGGNLALDVQEAFLRRITYTHPGLPQAIEVPFPYLIPVTAFPEGPSKITIRAEDRTGHVSDLEVNVERDTILPSVQILGPAAVYAGVPFDLSVPIVERSAHSISIDVNGTKVDLTGAAGEAAAGKTTTMKVTPPGVGELTVTARVTDSFGNEVVKVREFIAVLPVLDLRVNQVKLVTPATNTAAEGHGIVAVIEQVGGVAPLPVTVTFEAGGRSHTSTVTVPGSGPFEVRWDTKLPPGLQTVKVHAQGPPQANETLPGNENGTATIESFLGRITIGDKVYNVRSDARSLPTTLVAAGSSKTYPLTLVNQGAGVAYQATLEGNRTVVWDPSKPIMELEPAATQTSTDDGKDAPFPGLLVALAVIAQAALAQRRRA